MSKQKAIEEFYRLGALRLLRVENLPEDKEEQSCRHIVMGISKDNALVFFWARRVFRTPRHETYAEVTFSTPIIQSGEKPVFVPPGLYLISTKR